MYDAVVFFIEEKVEFDFSPCSQWVTSVLPHVSAHWHHCWVWLQLRHLFIIWACYAVWHIEDSFVNSGSHLPVFIFPNNAILILDSFSLLHFSTTAFCYNYNPLTNSVLQNTSLSPDSVFVNSTFPPLLSRYGGRRRQAVHQTSSRKHPSTTRRCASRASRGCRGVATTARPTTGWGWLPSSPSA